MPNRRRYHPFAPRNGHVRVGGLAVVLAVMAAIFIGSAIHIHGQVTPPATAVRTEAQVESVYVDCSHRHGCGYTPVLAFRAGSQMLAVEGLSRSTRLFRGDQELIAFDARNPSHVWDIGSHRHWLAGLVIGLVFLVADVVALVLFVVNLRQRRRGVGPVALPRMPAFRRRRRRSSGSDTYGTAG